MAVLPAGLVWGAVQLDFSFIPTLDSGTDPHGLTNSTWSFNMIIGQAAWEDDGIITHTSIESASLAISGSTGLDGSYALTELETGEFRLKIANSFQILILGSLSEYGTAAFDFGPVSVTNFSLSSQMGVFNPAVYGDDPVLAEPLNGIEFSYPHTFKTQTGVFALPATLLNASVTTTYVDTDATGLNDGSSWSNAFSHLTDALASSTNQSELWVAEGVYYPDETSSSDSNNRFDNFEVGAHVSLYGGFTGTETNRNERDHLSQPTILSGDIAQDDITTGHVITGDPESDIIGTNASQIIELVNDGNCILDGFILTGTDGDVALEGGGLLRRCMFKGNIGGSGGAIYHSWGQLDLVECEFINNRAYDAGAIRTENGEEIAITSCSFKGNAVLGGGGLYTAGALRISGGSPVITDSLFSGNHSGGTGGILYLYALAGQYLTLENCTISGNLSDGDDGTAVGGGIHGFEGGTFLVENSVIWGNSSVSNLNAIGIVTQEYSLVEGITASGSNLDGNNPANDPDFASAIAATNAPTSAGNYSLNLSSPLSNAGSAALLPSDIHDLDEDGNTGEMLPLDIQGNLRVAAGMDIGAYEFGTPSGLEQFRFDYSMAPDGSEDTADWSGNGVDNAQYFAFGLGDPNTAAIDETRLPQASFSSNQFHYAYVQLIDEAGSGIEFTIQSRTNLTAGSWTPVGAPASQDATPLDADYEKQMLTFDLNDPNCFYRLSISEATND